MNVKTHIHSHAAHLTMAQCKYYYLHCLINLCLSGSKVLPCNVFIFYDSDTALVIINLFYIFLDTTLGIQHFIIVVSHL